MAMRRLVGWMLAIGLATTACGPVLVPTEISGNCPEATVGSLPNGMRLTSRSFAESGAGATAIRAQYVAGARELTLLSGVAGEIPGTDTGVRRTVRGHEAAIREGLGDTRIAVWLEGAEGAPCSQYAVVATGLSEAEFEEILRSVR